LTIIFRLDVFFKQLQDTFDTFGVQHVYREKNMEEDSLSKAGLQLGFGQWLVSEVKDGAHYEYYHKTFIDDPSHKEATL
jgi:hypothetical protein